MAHLIEVVKNHEPEDEPRLSGIPASERSLAEREAISALHTAHVRELRQFLWGVVRDRDLAEDAIQSAFAKLLALGLDSVRAESRKAWLFQTAYRDAIATRRQGSNRDRILRALPLPSESGESEDLSEELVRKETVEAVKQALDALPADQKSVVLARIHDEKTFAEIARDSGSPLGTVLTRMRLALNRLRRGLGSETD